MLQETQTLQRLNACAAAVDAANKCNWLKQRRDDWLSQQQQLAMLKCTTQQSWTWWAAEALQQQLQQQQQRNLPRQQQQKVVEFSFPRTKSYTSAAESATTVTLAGLSKMHNSNKAQSQMHGGSSSKFHIVSKVHTRNSQKSKSAPLMLQHLGSHAEAVKQAQVLHQCPGAAATLLAALKAWQRSPEAAAVSKAAAAGAASMALQQEQQMLQAVQA